MNSLIIFTLTFAIFCFVSEPSSANSKLKTVQTIQAVAIPELSQLKNDDTAGLEGVLKNCLFFVSQEQLMFFKSHKSYARAEKEFNSVNFKRACNGVQLFTNLASEKEFKVTATLNEKVASIDQSRNLVIIK